MQVDANISIGTEFISFTIIAVIIVIIVIFVIFYYGGRGCCRKTERLLPKRAKNQRNSDVHGRQYLQAPDPNNQYIHPNNLYMVPNR